ncbi:MAG: MotA/TolQ/ExbB proton channel family protein, partial [Pseudomonadota bacterium]
SGQGSITFDPTLGRYQELQASKQTLVEHIRAGGIWVIPILAFALLSLAIAGIKLTQFAHLPALDARTIERMDQAIAGNDLGRDALTLAAPLSTLFELFQQKATHQQREDRLFELLLNERSRLQHLIGAVAITATVSPLLGLLGTVSGMINTFRSMTVFGSGDPSVVSGGISEALVTTELGLVVAVPSLVLHALLKRKADSYSEKLESLAATLAERPANLHE